MSDVREKLAAFIARENERCYEAWRKKYLGKKGKKLPELMDSSGQWADAILANFDLTEKKPRYFVSSDHNTHEGKFRLAVNDRDAGLRVATFHGGDLGNLDLSSCSLCEVRAREYCDFLNSKEPK